MVAGLDAELTALKNADIALGVRVTALETEIDGGTYSSTPPFFKG
jgi:hypothetical protein